MENLNAEQVKKALECCVKVGGYRDAQICNDCPLSEKRCAILLPENCLALINSQEQRIGELAIELEAMRGAANSYKMYSKTLEDENKKLRVLVDEGFDTENSLNGKIKELTEENENLKIMNELCQISEQSLRDLYDADTTAQSEVISRLIEENEKLTEENERLITDKVYWKNRAGDAELKLNREVKAGYAYGKADTVRKMHSEIKKRCIEGGIYPAFVASTIDQIAKEMLEGENEN